MGLFCHPYVLIITWCWLTLFLISNNTVGFKWSFVAFSSLWLLISLGILVRNAYLLTCPVLWTTVPRLFILRPFSFPQSPTTIVLSKSIVHACGYISRLTVVFSFQFMFSHSNTVYILISIGANLIPLLFFNRVPHHFCVINLPYKFSNKIAKLFPPLLLFWLELNYIAGTIWWEFTALQLLLLISLQNLCCTIVPIY